MYAKYRQFVSLPQRKEYGVSPNQKRKKLATKTPRHEGFTKFFLVLSLLLSMYENTLLSLRRSFLRESLVSSCLCGYFRFFVLGNLQKESDSVTVTLPGDLHSCNNSFSCLYSIGQNILESCLVSSFTNSLMNVRSSTGCSTRSRPPSRGLNFCAATPISFSKSSGSMNETMTLQ